MYIILCTLCSSRLDAQMPVEVKQKINKSSVNYHHCAAAWRVFRVIFLRFYWPPPCIHDILLLYYGVYYTSGERQESSEIVFSSLSLYRLQKSIIKFITSERREHLRDTTKTHK